MIRGVWHVSFTRFPTTGSWNGRFSLRLRPS